MQAHLTVPQPKRRAARVTRGVVANDPTSDAPDVDELDALFKGFADPTRLRILNVLAAGELCVCDIVELLGMPQSLISRHLAYLRRTGLVTMTREWKFAHYRLANATHPVHGTLIHCVRSCFRGITTLDHERVRAVARVQQRTGAACP